MGVDYYITQSRQKLLLEIGRSYRRDVVRKATPGRRARGPRLSLGAEKLLIKCSRSPSRVGLWASSWAALENEKDTTLTAIRVGVKILQFLFGLQLHLTRKPWVTLSNVTNKVRGTYLLKRSSCVFIIVSLGCCRWQYNNNLHVVTGLKYSSRTQIIYMQSQDFKNSYEIQII